MGDLGDKGQSGPSVDDKGVNTRGTPCEREASRFTASCGNRKAGVAPSPLLYGLEVSMKVQIDQWMVQVDSEDYEQYFVAGRAWHVCVPKNKPYLIWSTTRLSKKVTVKFHRLVMNAQPGQQVDHINGDSLDNRKLNLRLVTSLENNRNMKPRLGFSSRFKGVGWHKGGWRVRIRVNYQHISVGFFKDEVEAAAAYDLASLKYHGEYGCRNFLPLV